MANLANVAAQIHANMCNDEGFGYSWGERYGTEADPVYYDIDGQTYGPIYRGDYDCSSSVITAWQTALQHTPFAGALDGATYTGNMRDVFVNSGLFDIWDTSSTSAVRGDVYLNDEAHTAMCQDGGLGDGPYGYDCLSEFSINENGGVYGGQRGDQTGWESHIQGFYEYPWWCTLHYNGKADNTEPAPEPAPEPEPTPVPEKYPLVGIDIASWQEGIVPSATESDFVIIKVTGGTHYENPFWRQWADDVINSGKRLAFYHYAVESEDNPNARAEAEFFLSKIGDYIGKFIPVLDWEADALELPASWAREWLDIVAERTGSTPWFYGYASNVNSTDYSTIAEKYPLWMASYLSKYAGGGFVENPDQLWGFGNWSDITAYQYTSEGRISGYNGNLDLSVFYGTPSDWDAMAGGDYHPQPKPSPSGDIPVVKYRISTDPLGINWLDEMHDFTDTGGSGDDFAGDPGVAARWLAIDFGGNGWYQVCTERNGWLPIVRAYNIGDLENGCAGDGSRIVAVRAYYETPEPTDRYYEAEYRVAPIGSGYYPWMHDTYDTGGSSDDYAGDMVRSIDRFQIHLV